MKLRVEYDKQLAGELAFLALPLLIGNIFQQFYNIASTLIVGRYIGESAFAAIGVAGTVMNLYIFILNGGCVGISVMLASVYGSRDMEALRRGVFLSASAGSAFTILLSVLSIRSLPAILRLMQTPPELETQIYQYLSVILSGLVATFLYNLCAGMLRAVGDTKSALFFLIAAVLFNALLTLVLVAYFGFGISGAGWATVFSQVLSVALCVVYIVGRKPFLVVRRQDMRYDGLLLRRTAYYAFVSALHQSSLYIGKMFVQGTVNALGTSAIAAFTAAGRIEGLANAFGDSGAEAVSIATAHKTGAGDRDAARAVIRTGMVLMTALGILSSVVMLALAAQSVGLFLGSGGFSQESSAEGVRYIRVVASFYLLAFVASTYTGYFRGAGHVNIPFLLTTVQITLRVLLSWMLAHVLGLGGVALATGIGWVVMVALQFRIYRVIRH